MKCQDVKKHSLAIEEKLEKHVSQYKRNSKEVMKLAEAVKEITKEVREHRIISEEAGKANLKFHEDLKPVLENYKVLIGGRKIFLGVVITLSAIGSLWVLIKNIFYDK